MKACMNKWICLTVTTSFLFLLSACDGPADNETGQASGESVLKAELIQKTNVTTKLLQSATLDDGTTIQCWEVDFDDSPRQRHGPTRAIWRHKAKDDESGISDVLFEENARSQEDKQLFSTHCARSSA